MGQGYCILAAMTKRRDDFSHSDEEAGGREPFVDAELYDYEYRRRRADVTFYRQLARNRMEFVGGSIVDLACGSGRLLVPLLRDGHTVVGIDRSAEMLAAAQRRIRRLSLRRQQQCTLVRADLRAYALRRKATLAIAAFHSVQHLSSDESFVCFLAQTRASLLKGAWLVFDVLPPDPTWLGRDSTRRWAKTAFRHPTTRQRFVYTTNHTFDASSKLLHIRLYYQPVDGKGQKNGPERVIRLCHRQFWPSDIRTMLGQSGFRLVEAFGGFDGRILDDCPEGADEHIYLAVAV